VARRPRIAAALALAFPVGAYLLLRLGLLPPAWLGLPDGLFTLFLALGVGLDCRPSVRLALGAAAVLGLVALALWPARAAPFVPVPMNLLLARLFQATLRPGAEPMITRIARLARGEQGLPAELAAYTRRSTAAWAGLFLALAASSMALALFASAETAMLFANSLNFALIAFFFAAETLYRWLRYRGYWHPPLRQVVATLIHHGWRDPGVRPERKA
jgi:uncharacterized membrane protein